MIKDKVNINFEQPLMFCLLLKLLNVKLRYLQYLEELIVRQSVNIVLDSCIMINIYSERDFRGDCLNF